MRLKAVWLLLKNTLMEWQNDRVSLWAAAIAFYTIFSLAPLLILAIAIAGSIFGQEAAQTQLVTQIRSLIGTRGAQAVEGIINNAQQSESGGTIATLFGIFTLLIGASAVFSQLQSALNTIWDVESLPELNFRSFLQNRLLSFAMVLVIGFLLLVSLVISAIVATVANFFGDLFPGLTLLGQILDIAFSISFIAFLFALIYKVLPDVFIPWNNLWIGASVAACLFTFGKFLIGLYLGNSSISSSYGAAGSLVVILIWVYYSAQILLLGAEFTRVYTRQRGARITPNQHAISRRKH
jgi:membrane protein